MQVIGARAVGGLIVLLLVLGILAPASGSAVESAAVSALPPAPLPASPASQAPVRVRLSGQRLAAEVLVWLGEERGYFQQEGIEIEHVTFTSASEMIPALATGQLDVAPLPANPAMWNAIAR